MYFERSKHGVTVNNSHSEGLHTRIVPNSWFSCSDSTICHVSRIYVTRSKGKTYGMGFFSRMNPEIEIPNLRFCPHVLLEQTAFHNAVDDRHLKGNGIMEDNPFQLSIRINPKVTELLL